MQYQITLKIKCNISYTVGTYDFDCYYTINMVKVKYTKKFLSLSLKSLSPKRSQSLSVGFGNRRFQVSESLTENLNIKNERKSPLNQQQIEGDFGLFTAILHRKKAWNI